MLRATWNDLPEEAREYLESNSGWPASFNDEAGVALVGGWGPTGSVPLLLELGLLRRSDGESGPRWRIAPLVRAWLADTARCNDFSGQMCNALAQYGALGSYRERGGDAAVFG